MQGADAGRPIARALISVSDKTGLEALAAALIDTGVEILSTGGTAAALRTVGAEVRDVSAATGFPEIMDGRVKTLHPAVHGGLLARRDAPDHMAALSAHGLPEIDLLVANLYPFEAVVARGADPETVIENIDVGGPAMIRAAAKNHDFVTVITDPADYGALIAELASGGVRAGFRTRMAAKAFARVAAYDTLIAEWMTRRAMLDAPQDALPPRLDLEAERIAPLRYGENPHQRAAFYRMGPLRPGVANARLIQGKELSYNNIADADAAYEAVAEISEGRAGPAACVIVKHANPCGAALAATPAEAYMRAQACDPTSAFGGVVALDRPLDAETAAAILAIFTEVVIAPEADATARALLADRPNIRLLVADALPDPAAEGMRLTQVAGGLLLQDRDAGRIGPAQLSVVTKRAPTPRERADLLFAWRIAKHVKSNAIVYAKDQRTVGVGAGQMSRVDSTRIAARKAQDMAAAAGVAQSFAVGSVVASDAFFPFPDGLLAAAEAGATAAIQPGGSIRDDEVVAAADAAGLAMVFTGQRHFRH